MYPCAPLEPVTATKKRLEMKNNEINSFNISIINLMEKIAFFNDENRKSEEK